MSAIACARARARRRLRKGWCPGSFAADGDRRRVACAGARAERAPVARSGGRAGGRCDCLRQWGDRPFGSRQFAPARLERADPSRVARALEEAELSTPTLRSSACATLSQARWTTSMLRRVLDLGSSVEALETRLKEDQDLRLLPPKFSFVVDAKGACLSALWTRTSVSTRRATERLRSFSRAKTGWPPNARQPRQARSRCGSVSRFSHWPALAKGRLGGCAHWSSVRALRRLHEAALRASRSHVRDRARRCATLSARTATVPGSSSARRPLSVKSRLRLQVAIERARALNAHSVRLTPWRAFLIAGLDQHGAEFSSLRSRSWD